MYTHEKRHRQFEIPEDATVLLIVGPHAVGKTAASLALNRLLTHRGFGSGAGVVDASKYENIGATAVIERTLQTAENHAVTILDGPRHYSDAKVLGKVLGPLLRVAHLDAREATLTQRFRQQFAEEHGAQYLNPEVPIALPEEDDMLLTSDIYPLADTPNHVITTDNMSPSQIANLLFDSLRSD